jgi:GH24 family phage-related lysozyme (muramidase)
MIELTNAFNKYSRQKLETLPRGVRTAIFSVWRDLGPETFEYYIFWDAVLTSNWREAIHMLKNWYGPGKSDSRRVADAQIM